jgi:hypothetical protein
MALEVGKLAHELGCLIRLRQTRRFERSLTSAQPFHQPAHPLILVGERPRSGEEGDRTQPLHQPVDPERHITLEREARIVEAPFQHRLVPGTHHVPLAAVRDERETIAPQREVPLVRLHRRHDDPLRQLEEALVERALDHLDALDQVDHFLQHAPGITPGSDSVQAGRDLAAPFLDVRLHTGGAQPLHVLARMLDFDNPRGEAVPERRLADDRLLVELRKSPPHRAGEPDAAVVPAHRLRERKTADDRLEPLRDDLAQCAARTLDSKEAVA